MKKSLVRIRKILKKSYKPFLVFVVFVGAIVLVLPPIPIKIDHEKLQLEGIVGGYQIKLPFVGLFPSRKNFSLGTDFSGGSVLKLKFPEIPLEQDLSLVKTIISYRMKGLGYKEYSVKEESSAEAFWLKVTYPSSEPVVPSETFLAGRGFLFFKQLKADITWDEKNFVDYYFKPEVWEETGLDGNQILEATVNGSDVQIMLSDEGHTKFSEIAKDNIGRPLGIFLDEATVPLAMPLVSEELANMDQPVDPVIRGGLDESSAKLLSLQVNGGVLPVKLTVEEGFVFEPVLRSEALYKLLVIFGLALITLFSVLYAFHGKFVCKIAFSFLFYSVFLALCLKAFSVPLNIGILVIVGISLLVMLTRLLLVLFRLKAGLKKNKPYNLAVFQASSYGKKFFNYGGLVLAGFSLLGMALNFYELYFLYLTTLLGVLLNFLIFWRFYRTR